MLPVVGTTPVCVGICYAARKRRLNLIIASMPLKKAIIKGRSPAIFVENKPKPELKGRSPDILNKKNKESNYHP